MDIQKIIDFLNLPIVENEDSAASGELETEGVPQPVETGSPIIADRQVITESGKLLLKD